MSRLRHAFALAASLLAVSAPAAQTLVLYENDFESPNVPLEKNCGDALDTRGIDFLYGTPAGTFQQRNTVEAVLLSDPVYSDPSGTGGTAAIGMLCCLQDDLLALTFDTEGRAFLNAALDVTAIDVQGCGGPFGVAAPVFRLSLVDSPGGVFVFGSGTVLDAAEVTGTVGPDGFTADWTRHVVALDASGATDGTVTLVWDLLASGYAAFDNLVVAASDDPGDVPVEPAAAPGATALGAPYPSPVRGAATVPFALASGGPVRLSVYDLLGREVAVLAEGARPPGRHEARLEGGGLPSGVYVVRLVAGSSHAARTFALLR